MFLSHVTVSMASFWVTCLSTRFIQGIHTWQWHRSIMPIWPRISCCESIIAMTPTIYLIPMPSWMSRSLVLGANFSKKVWVFLIEILGFFCFLVSSIILGGFSKLIFFRVSCFKFFLVWPFGFFFYGFFGAHPKLFLEFISISNFVCIYIWLFIFY